MEKHSIKSLLAENQELKDKLAEAEKLIAEFKSGEIDAFSASIETPFSQNKKNEKELDSKKMLQSIFDQAPLALSVYEGPDYVISLANDLCCKIIGKNEEEVLGKKLFDLFPETAAQGFDKILSDIFSTGKPFYGNEFPVHFLKNGENFNGYFDFVYQPLFDIQNYVTGVICIAIDVTDKVLARQKIEESEKRFRIMADAAPNIVWALNPDGSQKYLNKYALDFLGLSLEKMVSLNWQPFIHPDDLESTSKAVTDAVQNRTLYSKEHRLLRHDGVYRWILSQGAPSFFENGELYGFVGSGIDITERKNTEVQLAYRTALLEAHNDASVDGILLVDPKGKILSINQRFIEIWNMPQHIIKAKDDDAALSFAMTQLVNPQQFIDKVKYLYKHPSEMSHDELEFKDGRIVERNGYSVLGEDSIYYAWCWTFRDITKQKKYEKTILESQEQFSTLANNIQNLAWIADSEGWIFWYNQRWFEYTGTTLEEMEGWGWGKVHHPDHIERVVNFVKKAWKENKPFELTFPLRGANGNYRWFLTRVFPVNDAEGNIIRWIGTNTDIEQQKLLSEQLEDMVRERTIQLNNVNENLQEKNIQLQKMNYELEAFNYVSSHDLQEPLRKIQTFAERIIEKEKDQLSENAKHYFERMNDAARRMQMLIEDLLIFSRLSTIEPEFECFDINTVIEEVIEEFHEVIIEKQAIIEVNSVCNLNIIRFQFRQLVQNLVSNAIKFSNRDIPPHIIIECRIIKHNESSNIKFTDNKDYCHISFSDNGIGFDNQYSEKIFQVFQRLHGRDKYPGTGIGLAIVKKIVDNHKGIITAESRLSKGAIFNIYLPI